MTKRQNPQNRTASPKRPAAETPVPATDDAQPAPVADAQPSTPTGPNPADVFVKAFVTVASSDTVQDSERASLLEHYRAVPGGGRATALNNAMGSALVAGANGPVVVELMNFVRDNATQRATRAGIDPATAFAIRLAGLHDASDGIQAPEGVDLTTVVSMSNDPAFRTDHAESIERVSARIVDAFNKGGGGPRGPVQTRRAGTGDRTVSAAVQHINEAMASQEVGTFLTTTQLAKIATKAYPSANPSPGALANACRNARTGEPLSGQGWTGTTEPSIGATRTADDADV